MEDKNGKTPLFNACGSVNRNFVEFFIEHGVDIIHENKLKKINMKEHH